MNDVTKSNAPVSYAEKAWQSDVIVDLIKHYDFPYIALNPGASYRGLHDSLVNYGGNQPPILLCQHEKIAVQIAHGFAKATGKPMGAIVHDVVGMLHATMGIYYAYIDRCPVFVIGATGPMDESRRRPFIDWIHTANVNGEQLRHYVKWDYQPSSIEGVPDSFSRAYAAMMTEPQGPIYMCYDAWLQEQPLSKDVALPKASDNKVPVPMAADVKALEAVAHKLLAAKYPVLMAGYVARRGVRRPSAAELSQPSSAQSELREGNFPRCRSDPVARHPRLGEIDPLQRPHQTPSGAALSANLRDDRD